MTRIPALLFATALSFGSNLPAADSLKVGDPAPEIRTAEWLKGAPVTAFEKGQVYVLEFWDTDCGWCKFAMPHLSELAKKYEGRVTFIGMDIHESAKNLPKVERFVLNAHEVMAYSAAADTVDGFMQKNWMTAAKRGGIPCTMVVDQDGTIAWIGHPALGLEQIVEAAVSHKLDAAARQQIDFESYKTRGQAAAYTAVMNEALKNPAMAAMAIYAADELRKLGSLWDFQTIPAKYLALAVKDPAAARAFANEMIARPVYAPTALMAFASKITAKENPHPDYPLALSALQAALKNSDPQNASLLAALAQTHFLMGDAAQAAALQEKVIEIMKAEKVPESAIATAQGVLKEFQGRGASTKG